MNKSDCLAYGPDGIRDDFAEANFVGAVFRQDLNRCVYEDAETEENCIPFKSIAECKARCGGK